MTLTKLEAPSHQTMEEDLVDLGSAAQFYNIYLRGSSRNIEPVPTSGCVTPTCQGSRVAGPIETRRAASGCWCIARSSGWGCRGAIGLRWDLALGSCVGICDRSGGFAAAAAGMRGTGEPPLLKPRGP